MDQSWTTNWIVLFPVHGALAIVVWERNGNPLRVLRARIALWTSPGWSLFRTQNQYDCDTNGHRMFMCESMIFWMFLCGCTAAAIRNKQRTKTEAGNLTDWSSRSSAPEHSHWMNESSTRTTRCLKLVALCSNPPDSVAALVLPIERIVAVGHLGMSDVTSSTSVNRQKRRLLHVVGI